MRKFFIGLFQIVVLALDWFYVPIAVGLIPCFLIRHFLFPLPYWVFFVSGTVFFLVNWLFYPFAMGVILLPVFIWGWLHPSGRAPAAHEEPVSPPVPGPSTQAPKKLP
jgi:hypothetical protein